MVLSVTNLNQSQVVEKKERLQTKVVVRRLPPRMQKDTFLEQVSPIPPHEYMYFVPGNISLGEHSFSRAYIHFTRPEDIYNFKDKFDNYVFLDSNGHEYPAVVEFAPFQKIPNIRRRQRVDPKCGTIESDPVYLEFIEQLNKPLDSDVQKPEYSLQLATDHSKDKNSETTPLLEFVKNKRTERTRIREERREERKRREQEKKLKPKDDVGEEGWSKTISKGRGRVFFGDELRDDNFNTNRRSRGKFGLNAKKEFSENREFKKRDFRTKNDELKTTESNSANKPRKVKKYTERREERKLAEAQNKQPGEETSDTHSLSQRVGQVSLSQSDSVDNKGSSDIKQSPSQRKIRNKDRPSIAIYRPGMLSKKKLGEDDGIKDNAVKE